jgi:hypothetical protein
LHHRASTQHVVQPTREKISLQARPTKYSANRDSEAYIRAGFCGAQQYLGVARTPQLHIV